MTMGPSMTTSNVAAKTPSLSSGAGKVSYDSDSDSYISSVPDTSSIRTTPGVRCADKAYYFDEKAASYIVDNVIYKVHDHFLVQESSIFADKLSKARQDNVAMVPLSDLSSLEFESLIDFFYRGMHDDYNPGIEGWKALLSISTKYKMDKVRARAIKEIDAFRPPVDAVEMLVLSKKFDVSAWVKPAYADLALRAERLSLSEAKRLDRKTIVDVAGVRELWRECRGIGSTRRGEAENRARVLALVNEILSPSNETVQVPDLALPKSPPASSSIFYFAEDAEPPAPVWDAVLPEPEPATAFSSEGNNSFLAQPEPLKDDLFAPVVSVDECAGLGVPSSGKKKKGKKPSW